MYRRHGAEHGFTLLELIIVLVVLGIISLTVLPRIGDTTAFTARGYFDEAVAAARYAQKIAVASGCPVQFSAGAAGYALHRPAEADCTGAWQAVAHPDRSSADFAGAPEGGSLLSGSPTSLAFDPAGTASADGSYTVTGGGFTGTFDIVSETGYVRAVP
jgi:MSHA pilin protein MshC